VWINVVCICCWLFACGWHIAGTTILCWWVVLWCRILSSTAACFLMSAKRMHGIWKRLLHCLPTYSCASTHPKTQGYYCLLLYSCAVWEVLHCIILYFDVTWYYLSIVMVICSCTCCNIFIDSQIKINFSSTKSNLEQVLLLLCTSPFRGLNMFHVRCDFVRSIRTVWTDAVPNTNNTKTDIDLGGNWSRVSQVRICHLNHWLNSKSTE